MTRDLKSSTVSILLHNFSLGKTVKAISHDVICVIRFFCTIMWKVNFEGSCVQPIASHQQALMNSKFFAIGPRLYNKLSPDLLELETTSVPTKQHAKVKSKLSQCLSKIPDYPRGITTNSLLDCRCKTKTAQDNVLERMLFTKIITKYGEIEGGP